MALAASTSSVGVPHSVDHPAVVLHALGADGVEGGQQQVGHRAEVVEDQPLVETRPARRWPGRSPRRSPPLSASRRRHRPAALGFRPTGRTPLRTLLGAPDLAIVHLRLSVCSNYTLKPGDQRQGVMQLAGVHF